MASMMSMDRTGSPGSGHSDEEAGAGGRTRGQGWPLGLRRVSMRMKNVSSDVELLMDVTTTSTSSRSSSSATGNYYGDNNYSQSRHNHHLSHHNDIINSSSSSSCFPSSSSSSSFSSPFPHLHDNESTTSIFPDVRSITLGYLMGMSGRGEEGNNTEASTENVVGDRIWSAGGGDEYRSNNHDYAPQGMVDKDMNRCVAVGNGRKSGGRIICRLLSCQGRLAAAGLKKCLSGGGGGGLVQRWALSSSSSSSSYRSSSDNGGAASDSVPSTFQIYNCGGCCFNIIQNAAALFPFNNYSSSSNSSSPDPLPYHDSSTAAPSIISPPPSDSALLPHSLADFLAEEKRARPLAAAAADDAYWHGSRRKNDDSSSSMEDDGDDDEEEEEAVDDNVWKRRKRLFPFVGGRSVALWTRVHVNLLYEENEAAGMVSQKKTVMMSSCDVENGRGEMADIAVVDHEKKGKSRSWRRRRRYRTCCVVVNTNNE